MRHSKVEAGRWLEIDKIRALVVVFLVSLIAIYSIEIRRWHSSCVSGGRMMRQTLEYLYCRRHKLKRRQFVRAAYLAACRWYVRPLLRVAIVFGWANVRYDLEFFEDLRDFTSRS